MSVAGNRGGSGFRLPEEVEVVEVREAAGCGAAKKSADRFRDPQDRVWDKDMSRGLSGKRPIG